MWFNDCSECRSTTRGCGKLDFSVWNEGAWVCTRTNLWMSRNDLLLISKTSYRCCIGHQHPYIHTRTSLSARDFLLKPYGSGTLGVIGEPDIGESKGGGPDVREYVMAGKASQLVFVLIGSTRGRSTAMCDPSNSCGSRERLTMRRMLVPELYFVRDGSVMGCTWQTSMLNFHRYRIYIVEAWLGRQSPRIRNRSLTTTIVVSRVRPLAISDRPLSSSAHYRRRKFVGTNCNIQGLDPQEEAVSLRTLFNSVETIAGGPEYRFWLDCSAHRLFWALLCQWQHSRSAKFVKTF